MCLGTLSGPQKKLRMVGFIVRAFCTIFPPAQQQQQLPPAGPRFHQLPALQAASAAAAKLRETSASEVKTQRRRQPPVGLGSAADQHALLLAGERFEGDCRKGEK